MTVVLIGLGHLAIGLQQDLKALNLCTGNELSLFWKTHKYLWLGENVLCCARFEFPYLDKVGGKEIGFVQKKDQFTKGAKQSTIEYKQKRS